MQNIKYLLLFHGNSGYVNSLQCYVTHVLLFLLGMFLGVKVDLFHIS